MKKTTRNITVITLLVIILCLCNALVNAYRLKKENAHNLKLAQEALARKLGVTIEDYSQPEFFPESYFYEVLKPGMSKDEVRKIIIGYEAVYTCGYNIQVYYYFSKDDKEAKRFEILYDRSDKFYMLRAEDDDSGSIFIEYCDEGILDD